MLYHELCTGFNKLTISSILGWVAHSNAIFDIAWIHDEPKLVSAAEVSGYLSQFLSQSLTFVAAAELNFVIFFESQGYCIW